MRNQLHNKLVRDNIPQILRSAGITVESEIIKDDPSYLKALLNKLEEEVDEIITAEKDHLLEELGDLQTVVDTILKHHGWSRLQLTKQQKKKDQERGTFEKRIFLISTGGK